MTWPHDPENPSLLSSVKHREEQFTGLDLVMNSRRRLWSMARDQSRILTARHRNG